MVLFKLRNNDFKFFAKANQHKYNSVRVKTKKINFDIPQIQGCIPTNPHLLNAMVPSKMGENTLNLPLLRINILILFLSIQIIERTIAFIITIFVRKIINLQLRCNAWREKDSNFRTCFSKIQFSKMLNSCRISFTNKNS